MPVIIIVGIVVLFLWTKEIFFTAPPKKDPEEVFGEALAKYLKAGINTNAKPRS